MPHLFFVSSGHWKEPRFFYPVIPIRNGESVHPSKKIYQLHLYLLFPDVFPVEVLEPLARYLINPKASSDTDVTLSMAMRQFDQPTKKSLIFEIPVQSKFHYNEKMYIKGEKRRTRFECTEVHTHRKYIFHPHAEVDLIK